MNWKVGDRFIIVQPDERCIPAGIKILDDKKIIDYTGRITGGQVFITICDIRMPYWHGRLDDHPFVKDDTFLEICLRKIEDDYDGRQVTSWDSCPWRPAAVKDPNKFYWDIYEDAK